MTYGALLEAIEPLGKGGPEEAKGCRFNAYFWAEDEGEAILELFGVGFRIFGGLIHPPSYTTRGGTHPNIFLPRQWAEKLVDAVLTDERIRGPYAHIFPLIHRDGLVKELMFRVAGAKAAFPEFAKQRGLLGE